MVDFSSVFPARTNKRLFSGITDVFLSCYYEFRLEEFTPNGGGFEILDAVVKDFDEQGHFLTFGLLVDAVEYERMFGIDHPRPFKGRVVVRVHKWEHTGEVVECYPLSEMDLALALG